MRVWLGTCFPLWWRWNKLKTGSSMCIPFSNILFATGCKSRGQCGVDFEQDTSTNNTAGCLERVPTVMYCLINYHSGWRQDKTSEFVSLTVKCSRLWIVSHVHVVCHLVLSVCPLTRFIFQEYRKTTRPALLTCGHARIAFVMRWKAKIRQYVPKTVQVWNKAHFLLNANA